MIYLFSILGILYFIMFLVELVEGKFNNEFLLAAMVFCLAARVDHLESKIRNG